MTTGSHVRPPASPAGSTAAGPPEPRRRRLNPWRIGTPVVVLLSGSLFAVSAVNSDGTDLRAGRYTDLASLVQAEADQYEELRAQVQDLSGEVADLTSAIGDRDVQRVQGRIEELRDPAGLTPRSGTGLRIVLSDSTLDPADTEQPLKFLVVHQQDIQAVVNAMWRGGATAVTVQGQRIVSTTGIKCEANSVTLQGVPYPQPYVIEAVGDPESLATSVDGDSYLGYYRAQSVQDDIRIGWEMTSEEQVEAPAYDGLLDLSYAEPIT